MAHIFDTAKFSQKQGLKAIDLISHNHFKEYNFKRLEIFEYGGRVFVGNYEVLVTRFVRADPDVDFYVWLQQQGHEVIIRKPNDK